MKRRAYFESVADQWDDWNKEAELLPRIRRDMEDFHIRPGEYILDLGCGTGILLEPLLDATGDKGLVVGVDYALGMLQRAAARKIRGRVSYCVADAAGLPLADDSLDRIVCFSTWPHFPDSRRVLAEARRVLRPEGLLHIWHVNGRDAINAIHSGIGGVIGSDLLVPAKRLAEDAVPVGYRPMVVIDEPDRYLVSLRRTN